MLAERLPAYDGAVRASLRRIAEEMAEDEDDEPYGVPAGISAPPGIPAGMAVQQGAGESFDSRYARAVPVTDAAAGEAEIARLMAGMGH